MAFPGFCLPEIQLHHVKPLPFTSEQIFQLGPPCYETIARAEWTDRNEHVNIRYYVVMFDEAGDAWYPSVRITSGTMDLEHHINYIREIRPGDRLAVYMRIIGVSDKRLHYVMFLWNESTSALAALFECVNTFVDLSVRKTAPWPEDIRKALDALLARHAALPWPAPMCGVMSA